MTILKSIWFALAASLFCLQPLQASLYLYVEVARYDTFYFDDPVTFYDYSFNLSDDIGLVSGTSFIRSDGFNAMTRPADVGDTLASLKPYLIGDWTAETPNETVQFSILDFDVNRFANAAQLAATEPVTSPLLLNFQANQDAFTWTLGRIQHRDQTFSQIEPTPQGESLTFDAANAESLYLDFYTYTDGNDRLVLDTSQSAGLTGDLFLLRFNTSQLTVTAVPEPSSIVLCSVVAIGLVVLRRRRRQ